MTMPAAGRRPASPQARQTLIARRVPMPEYQRMGAAFADLGARAAEPNPHLSPAALAAATATQIATTETVILAASDMAEPSRLLGVWALRIARPRWALGLAVLKAPANPVFEPLSHPVLDSALAAPALAAMLAATIADPLLPKLIHAPHLPVEGVAFDALTDALAETAGSLTCIETWQRATCVPAQGENAEAALQAMLGKKLKRLKAKRAALAAQGALSFHMHSGQAAIAATRRFLALEAKGWKGATGTAMACNARDAAFALKLAEESAADCTLLVPELALNDQMIASALMPASAGVMSFFKTTYDEALRAHSPGVLLDVEITRALLAMPGFRLMDSGMDDSAPPESTIWPGRRAMAHGLIALGPAPAAWLAAHGLRLRQLIRTFKQRLT